MAISRAQMRSQLTGNRMKKKTEKKALGGIMLAKKLGAGAIPTVAAARSIESGEPEGILKYTPMGMMMRKARGMKAGGKVRGDGVCKRGKTKGRFV